MQRLWVLPVAVMMASPAVASQSTYLFNVTSGAFVIDVSPDNFVAPEPATIPVAGTFSVTITDNDGHLGAGDTFTLGAANLYNSEQKVVHFVNWAGTATFAVGSTKINNFNCPVPGVIGQGGIGTIVPDVHVVSNFTVAGCTGPYVILNGFWPYASWQDVDVQTFHLNFDIRDGVPVGVTLDGLFNYTYNYLGLDFGSFGHSVQVEGVLVPEPSSVGLAMLVSAGLVAWSRRRRSARR
jgi:hypothetical protein